MTSNEDKIISISFQNCQIQNQSQSQNDDDGDDDDETHQAISIDSPLSDSESVTPASKVTTPEMTLQTTMTSQTTPTPSSIKSLFFKPTLSSLSSATAGLLANVLSSTGKRLAKCEGKEAQPADSTLAFKLN